MRITDEQIRHLEKPRPTLLELMRQVDRPPARRPKLLEMVGYFLGGLVVCGGGLLALPLVITVLGAIAPIAAVAWFVWWAIKRARR